jgi:hypothetical protein
MTNTTVHESAARLANPLFYCSWDRAVFLHYRVAPEFLQRQIPYELDLHDGQAYVSLVAFTLRKMRLNHPHLRFMTQPLHTHAFLNVRTYVRVGEMRGIHFLAEWLNNRLATMLGPILYGLPYRFGSLDYHHDSAREFLCGEVRSREKLLQYRGSLASTPAYEPATPGTLDHFLLERYIAFTKHGFFRRLFQVWHEPWPQTAINAEIECDSLVHATGSWFSHAQFVSANFSPGLGDVQMGWPEKI